jgi:signal transduction histidine kinase/ActR/RegA family two-component response regulator
MTLGRRLLLFTAPLAILIVLALTATAFFAFFDLNRDQIVASLKHNVRVAAETHGDVFRTTQQTSLKAAEALRLRIERLDPKVDVDAEFDRIFPQQADGTRRSASNSFDGVRWGEAGYAYGMGAFISGATPLDRERKIFFLSVYDVVQKLGEGLVSGIDNFYFFTADNALVMFAPQRADRLEYYRFKAPADFDFSNSPPVQFIKANPDPGGRMLCTPLENVISDKNGPKISSGCLSPFVQEGRLKGAWGTTLLLDGWMRKATTPGDGLPAPFVIDQFGGVVAHQDILPGAKAAKTSDEVAADIGAKALAERIAANKTPSGVFKYAPWDAYIAYATFEGPNWRYVVSVPASVIQAKALQSSLAIALIGLLAMAALGGVLVYATERFLGAPLKLLAAQAGGDGRFRDSPRFAEAWRDDEIGALARSFAARDARFAELTLSLERRVTERTQELEEQRALAESANLAKSAFLAKMSHEIRTPMNGVLGMASALSQTPLSEPQQRMLKVVTDSGDALMTVLNEILDLSKIEAGKMEIETAPFDLSNLIRSVAALHAMKAEEKGLKFDVEGLLGEGVVVIGDGGRLRQILNNLLANAVKFTDKGSVLLRATVDEKPNAVTALFEVVDTGPGIDAATQTRIFQPFVQADASTTRRYGGTGLGLAIAKALALLMGGELTVESAAGRGATFRLRIGLERAPAGFAEVAARSPTALSRRMCVLAADDNLTNRLVLKTFLDQGGVDGVYVDSGAAAVEAFKSQRFDVVLMDIQMPEMDGVEATRRIREYEAARGAKRTPVLALTANVMRHQVDEYLAQGLDGALAKPLRAPDLFEAIRRCTAEADAA